MTFYRQDCVVASHSIRGTARCWICVGAYREGYGALVCQCGEQLRGQTGRARYHTALF
jgi:hypothetical protein